MAAYGGSALYLQWITSAGTTVLTGDYRTFTSSPSVALYQETAGADTDESYVVGVKNRTLQVGYVDQAGGTAALNQLNEGQVGTLVVSPEGTASTKRKETYPAICQGYQRSQPYNDVVTITIPFQGNGTPTLNGAW